MSLGCRWGQGGRQTLPVLHTLDLSGNSLTGTLPGNWGQDSAMSSLVTLDLQKNNFSGSIPASWGVSAANQPRFSQLTGLAVQPGEAAASQHLQKLCSRQPHDYTECVIMMFTDKAEALASLGTSVAQQAKVMVSPTMLPE